MSTVTSSADLPAAWGRGKDFAEWVVSWFNRSVTTMPEDEPIPTRASMLERLKDPADQATWEEFHRTYRGLIFGVARRAGLNETEADEVVQETLIGVARKMPEFRYDPARDSFKGWLLRITRWRIADQFRKRPVAGARAEAGSTASDSAVAPPAPAGRLPLAGPPTSSDGTARTATIDRIPDPAGLELSGIWEEEWEKHLLNLALARIKRLVNPAHYEIYHLHVILGKSVAEVKRALGVNAGQVYLARHRVGALLKKEIRKLQTEV